MVVVVVVCPPSLPSIWILACRTRSRLSASPVVEIYGRGFRHSAVFEIALPCVSPLRSLLPFFPTLSPASGSPGRKKEKKKKFPPKAVRPFLL